MDFLSATPPPLMAPPLRAAALCAAFAAALALAGEAAGVKRVSFQEAAKNWNYESVCCAREGRLMAPCRVRASRSCNAPRDR